ncbi:MAG: fatty acid desaturase, partial [Shimia sp.]
HRDARLTDPYDDPESNYLAARAWAGLGPLVRLVLRANNTLAGRLILGPVVGHVQWIAADLRGGPAVLRGWLWHLPAAAIVLAAVVAAPMPVWAYAIAVYLGLAILKIRTFLEHQAHEHAGGRSVVIEARGAPGRLLAFLFLNNNLHVVHHMHPRVPWYRLPALYAQNRTRYLARNHGYRYASYGEVFRRHLWRAKDPVVHPLWHRDG